MEVNAIQTISRPRTRIARGLPVRTAMTTTDRSALSPTQSSGRNPTRGGTPARTLALRMSREAANGELARGVLALVRAPGDFSGGWWCARMKTDTPQGTVRRKQSLLSRDHVNLALALSGRMAAGESAQSHVVQEQEHGSWHASALVAKGFQI